jgi:TatD DNase family protein
MIISKVRAWLLDFHPEGKAMQKQWIDSHSHLADERLDLRRDEMIRAAKARGLTQFLQGGVGPEDWQRQKALVQQYPQEILLCFGLHPYWVHDHSEDECEKALDLLATESASAVALGEMGLDLRPQYEESRLRQIDCFEKQLEFAQLAHKPVVLHLVRAFTEAQQILSLFGVPSRGGLVHSFNGSLKQAETYLSLGLHLSVGGPLCRPDNQRLRQAVAAIPLEKLLIETDSPDQPPPSHQHQLNEPTTLFEVAQAVADIKKISSEEVLDRSSANLRKLLALP